MDLGSFHEMFSKRITKGNKKLGQSVLNMKDINISVAITERYDQYLKQSSGCIS